MKNIKKSLPEVQKPEAALKKYNAENPSIHNITIAAIFVNVKRDGEIA